MEYSRRQILAISSCATALMGADQNTPPLPDDAVALIQGAFGIFAEVGSQIWPGWVGTSVPFVYVDSEWEYALHFPKELSGFVQTGVEAHLRTPVQVRRRVFSPDISATMDVQGIIAVVFGSPAATQKSPARWQLTIQHEIFHVFQGANHSSEKIRALKLGPEHDASWQLNFPFPYSDPEVMRLIHLQGYLAYIGISSQTPDDARYAAGSVLDAVRVYRAYLNRIDPGGCYRYSQFQEWTEGVAFYVEYQMAKLMAQSGEQYRQAWNSDYSGRLVLVKHAGRAAKSRTAFYHLGMGKALLLDVLNPKWKEAYFSPDVWLDDLLETAVRVG